jgi:hypothetical protein
MTDIHDNRRNARRRRSSDGMKSFGGVLLGLGIGWVAMNYVNISFDTLPYLFILAGLGIATSSSVFKKMDYTVSEVSGGLIGGLVMAIVFSSIFSGAFMIPFGGATTGSGNYVTETYSYSDFEEIEAKYGIQVKLTQDDEYSVSVKIDDNLFEKLDISKEGDTLKIKLEPGIYTRAQAVATITMPDLTRLDLATGSHGKVTDFTITDDIDINVSTGSHLTMSGTGEDVSLDVTTGSHADLSGFKADNVDASYSAGSHGSVFADGDLDADISTGSQVSYYGNPDLGRISVSSGSSLSPR